MRNVSCLGDIRRATGGAGNGPCSASQYVRALHRVSSPMLSRSTGLHPFISCPSLWTFRHFNSPATGSIGLLQSWASHRQQEYETANLSDRG